MDTRKLMVNGLLEYIGQAGAGKVVLPDGYAPVEYLECTGEQYIRIHTKPSLDWRMRGEFMLRNNTESQFFWACRKSVGTYPYFSLLNITTSGIRVDYADGVVQTATRPAVGSKFTLEQNKGVTTYNGSVINTQADGVAQVNSDILLGAANAQDVPIAYYLKGRIYMFEVINGTGTLVHALHPCLRLSDMKPGMYDVAGDQFLINQGIGADFGYYSASDYVQDGLVGIWDGIENAGAGVHLGDTTVWVDHVGGRNLALNTMTQGRSAFTDRAFYMADVSSNNIWAAASSNGVFTNYRTGEIVGKAVGAWYDWFNVGDRHRGFYIGGTASNGYLQGGTSLSQYRIRADIYTDFSFSVIYDANATNDSYPMAMYYNGTEQTMLTGATTGYRQNTSCISVGGRYNVADYGGCGYIYCIRLYNRPLTEEEIAHNYMIDHFRFGI